MLPKPYENSENEKKCVQIRFVKYVHLTLKIVYNKMAHFNPLLNHGTFTELTSYEGNPGTFTQNCRNNIRKQLINRYLKFYLC